MVDRTVLSATLPERERDEWSAVKILPMAQAAAPGGQSYTRWSI